MNTSSSRLATDDLSSALGERIRAARGEQGVTLRGLAERIGVSPATMSAIENGRTSISAVRLAEISHVLGVSVETLLNASAPADVPARLRDDAPARHWRRYDAATFEPPLQAALEAFLELGYHGSTMRDIARRANLSVPGIYHHYASKQEMLVAILENTVDDLAWRVEDALAESDEPVARLSHVVECLVLFHTRRREWGFVGRSELRSIEGEARDRIRVKRIEIQRLVTRTVEGVVEAGRGVARNPADAARAIVLMCVGSSEWFTETGPQTPEDIAEEYVELTLRMLGAESPA